MQSDKANATGLTHYLTPDRRLLLRSDGVLVPLDLLTVKDAKEPTQGVLKQVLPVAAGRGLNALSASSDGGGLADALELSENTRKVFKIVGDVAEVAGKVAGVYEGGKKALEILGVIEQNDPLKDLVTAIDQKLHQMLKTIQADIYASWASNRKVQMDMLKGQAGSALRSVRDIILYQRDLNQPLNANRLALADQASSTCMETLTASGPGGGFWMRPYYGNAIRLDEWKDKFDDRASVTEDGLVWDYRLGLPIFCYALAVRILVLRVLHPETRDYCAELTEHADFLQDVQDWMAGGIRRKQTLSQGEKKFARYPFSLIHFTAGAVDVHTGLRHEINVDERAQNLAIALGFPADYGPLNPIGPLDPADVAQTITADDIEMRWETDYAPILQKQAALSFTNLRWIIGLQELCILNKNVRSICPSTRASWVRAYDGILETMLQSVHELPKGSMGTKLALARELTKLVHPEKQQNSAKAMGDLFHPLRQASAEGQPSPRRRSGSGPSEPRGGAGPSRQRESGQRREGL